MPARLLTTRAAGVVVVMMAINQLVDGRVSVPRPGGLLLHRLLHRTTRRLR